MDSIRERVDRAKRLQSKYFEEIMNLQKECTHPNHTRIGRSDTGNWDRSQDSYWWECKCPDCDKKWTEDQ